MSAKSVTGCATESDFAGGPRGKKLILVKAFSVPSGSVSDSYLPHVMSGNVTINKGTLAMTYTAAQIIEWCESDWDAWKADCSGFVKAVCKQADASLHGHANQIMDHLETSSAWENLGASPDTATSRANSGCLVIGGLKQPAHGHVVIVVRSAPLSYPVAYWGRFGGVGRKNTTINWSWKNSDRPNIRYFSFKT
jgi:hypothetical protein